MDKRHTMVSYFGSILNTSCGKYVPLSCIIAPMLKSAIKGSNMQWAYFQQKTF